MRDLAKIVAEYEALREACFQSIENGTATEIKGRFYRNLSADEIASISVESDVIEVSGQTWTNIFGGSMEPFVYRIAMLDRGDLT